MKNSQLIDLVRRLNFSADFEIAKTLLRQLDLPKDQEKSLRTSIDVNSRNYEFLQLKDKIEPRSIFPPNEPSGFWFIKKTPDSIIFHGQINDHSDYIFIYINDLLFKVLKTHPHPAYSQLRFFSWAMQKPEITRLPQHCHVICTGHAGPLHLKNGRKTVKLKNSRGKNTIHRDLENGYVFYKNGNLILRRDFDSDWRNLMTRRIKETTDYFFSRFGYEIFAIGGTLLSTMRDSDFIPHDGDVDLAYLSKFERAIDVKRELIYIREAMAADGWEVKLSKTGCVKPYGYGEGDKNQFDIFPIWWESGVMYSPPWHGYNLPPEAFFPLKTGILSGAPISIPAEPANVLEKWYGTDWAEPDPSFQPSTAPGAEKILESVRFSQQELIRVNRQDEHQ